MELFLTRHGQSTYNELGRYAGSTDAPLTEKGVLQAEEVAEKLKDEKFDVIVSSNLLRAKRTADIINKYHNKEIQVIPGFAERNMGVFEGMTKEEAKEKFPEIWERKSVRSIDDGPDGGETIRQCDARITSALKKLSEEYPDKKVLLVCHGFAARVINRYIKGLEFEDMHNFVLGNCEVIEYIL